MMLRGHAGFVRVIQSTVQLFLTSIILDSKKEMYNKTGCFKTIKGERYNIVVRVFKPGLHGFKPMKSTDYSSLNPG